MKSIVTDKRQFTDWHATSGSNFYEIFFIQKRTVYIATL